MTFISAEVQTLPPVTQNTCTQLVQSHPNATFINITSVRYPNGSEDTTMKAMTTTNGIVYTYNFCSTSETGQYIVSTCGDGDGVIDCPPPYDFPVTWTGLTEAQERSRLFWVYSAAILLFLVFTVMAWKIEMTWLGFLAGIMLILPGISMMIHGFGFEDQILIRGIATVLIAIGMLTMVVFAFEYNHFFGLSSLFGDAEEKEGKAKDEYDYYDNPND